MRPGETLYGIATAYGLDLLDVMQWNGLKSELIAVGQALRLTPPSPERLKKGEQDLLLAKPFRIKKIHEEGFAAVIEDSHRAKRHYALHKNLPVGTLIKVKNRMNDKAIIARVIGTLPAVSMNRKLLLRLSQSAYQALKVPDLHVPVRVTSLDTP